MTPQYTCSNCKYKFSTFRQPKKCPYCSKESTVREEESAEDILKEVDNMIEEGKSY